MTESELFVSSLRLMFSLVIVLGVLFTLFYFLKKIGNVHSRRINSGSLQVTESIYIGIKKQISVVKVPGALLILGISSDRISLLRSITDSEIIREYETGMREGLADGLPGKINRFTGGFLRLRRKK